jgi:hypothetical protein
MRVLGAIASAQGLHQADYFSTFLESVLDHRKINQMRKNRISGDKDVRSWGQNPERPAREFAKELAQRAALFLMENREARKRTAFASIKGRRNAPHTTAAGAQFSFFLLGILFEPVRRIGDNGMNGIRLPCFHPFEAVA